MHIKINKNSVNALGVVLSKISQELYNEIENVQGELAAIHTYFLDPSYDSYSSEYMTQLCELNKQCEELQIRAVRVEGYAKKLADI